MKTILLTALAALMVIGLTAPAFADTGKDPVILDAYTRVVSNDKLRAMDFEISLGLDIDIPKEGNAPIHPNSGYMTSYMVKNGTTSLNGFFDIDTEKSTVTFRNSPNKHDSTQLNYHIYSKPNSLGEVLYYNIAAEKVDGNYGKLGIYQFEHQALFKLNADNELVWWSHHDYNSLVVVYLH